MGLAVSINVLSLQLPGKELAGNFVRTPPAGCRVPPRSWSVHLTRDRWSVSRCRVMLSADGVRRGFPASAVGCLASPSHTVRFWTSKRRDSPDLCFAYLCVAAEACADRNTTFKKKKKSSYGCFLEINNTKLGSTLVVLSEALSQCLTVFESDLYKLQTQDQLS